ncbi:MAG: sigma factor-like helix-turn-helix DNA-binding protein, partial [Gammaproteobacteria bacterium]
LGLESATAFADDILDHLTPVEAEVLYYYFLEHENHQQIAERLAKQRPTVTVALQRAKYSQLELYIRNMDQLIRLNHAGD